MTLDEGTCERRVPKVAVYKQCLAARFANDLGKIGGERRLSFRRKGRYDANDVGFVMKFD